MTWTLTGTTKTAEDLSSEATAAERARVKARRDVALISGTTVAGMSIATDDVSQQRIVGAALGVTLDPESTIQWKTGGGFVTLNAAQVIAIAQAVRAHVQGCFDREAEILDAIENDEDYDLEAGWPS